MIDSKILNKSCLWHRVIGIDKDGVKTTLDIPMERVYIEIKTQSKQENVGIKNTSYSLLICNYQEPSPELEDEITYNGVSYTIKEKNVLFDMAGVSHIEYKMI